jgi:hypothetical protein
MITLPQLIATLILVSSVIPVVGAEETSGVLTFSGVIDMSDYISLNIIAPNQTKTLVKGSNELISAQINYGCSVTKRCVLFVEDLNTNNATRGYLTKKTTGNTTTNSTRVLSTPYQVGIEGYTLVSLNNGGQYITNTLGPGLNIPLSFKMWQEIGVNEDTAGDTEVAVRVLMQIRLV